MSKKNIFVLSLVITLTMSYSAAFGATISASTTIGGGSYSTSNNVKISVTSTTVNYAAASGHTSGDRSLGTNNVDPKIYWTTKTVGSAPSDVTSATSDFTGWTAL